MFETSENDFKRSLPAESWTIYRFFFIQTRNFSSLCTILLRFPCILKRHDPFPVPSCTSPAPYLHLFPEGLKWRFSPAASELFGMKWIPWSCTSSHTSFSVKYVSWSHMMLCRIPCYWVKHSTSPWIVLLAEALNVKNKPTIQIFICPSQDELLPFPGQKRFNLSKCLVAQPWEILAYQELSLKLLFAGLPFTTS